MQFSRFELFFCVFRMWCGPNQVFIVQRFKLLDFVSGLFFHYDHDVLVGSVEQTIFSPGTAEVVALSRFRINLDAALVVLGLDDVVPCRDLDRSPAAVHEVHSHCSIDEESDAYTAAAIETRTIEIQGRHAFCNRRGRGCGQRRSGGRGGGRSRSHGRRTTRGSGCDRRLFRFLRRRSGRGTGLPGETECENEGQNYRSAEHISSKLTEIVPTDRRIGRSLGRAEESRKRQPATLPGKERQAVFSTRGEGFPEAHRGAGWPPCFDKKRNSGVVLAFSRAGAINAT